MTSSKHTAAIEIEYPPPDILSEVLEPEIDDIEGRATTNLETRNNSTFIHIQAPDVTSLRAAFNTWLRICNTSRSVYNA